MMEISRLDYYEAIIDLTKADNGPKGVTKALREKDHQTLEQRVAQQLAQREVALHALNVLTDEEKRIPHPSGFPQASYVSLRKICFLVLAAHASLCLVSIEKDDPWRSLTVLVREEETLSLEVVMECVWGLLLRCHLDRTFHNGMQRAEKQNDVSDRMVRTIYLGAARRLFHFPAHSPGN